MEYHLSYTRFIGTNNSLRKNKLSVCIVNLYTKDIIYPVRRASIHEILLLFKPIK